MTAASRLAVTVCDIVSMRVVYRVSKTMKSPRLARCLPVAPTGHTIARIDECGGSYEPSADVSGVIAMLSMKRYRWLCVLAGEVAYGVCLLGGLFPLRSGAGTEVHHALFETLPGFVWINPGSVILGAVYVFAFSWIFGSYMVWMHNTSLIEPETKIQQPSSERKGVA